PAHTELYRLSLHDALPIFERARLAVGRQPRPAAPKAGPPPVRSAGSPPATLPLVGRPAEVAIFRAAVEAARAGTPRAVLLVSGEDRKSTRLNSSHVSISYA